MRLFFASLLLIFPSITYAQQISPQQIIGTAVVENPTGSQTISQPTTTSLAVSNINSIINPMVCGTATPPSWCSGTDPADWINLAYKQLPTGGMTIGTAGGGEIDIPSGNYVISDPILFETFGKPVLLKCAPGTSFTWSTNSPYKTTGTMVTLDWGWTSAGAVNIQTPQGGIDGCQFFGNVGTSTGIGMGGGNGGSVGAHIKDTMVYGFGTGLHFFTTTLPPFLTTIANSFFNTSTINVVVDAGLENIHFFGGNISNNGNIGLQVNNNSADVYLFGVSFDDDGIQVNGGTVNLYSCHFENPNMSTPPHYIQTTTNGSFVYVHGGVMFDDRVGAAGDYFINVADGDAFEMDNVNSFVPAGTTLTSLITSTGIPFLNLTNVSPIGGGVVFHNAAGTSAVETSIGWTTGIRAIDLPVIVGWGSTVNTMSESNLGIFTFNNNGHIYSFDNAGNIIAPIGGGFAVGSSYGITKTCTTFPLTVVGGIITGC